MARGKSWFDKQSRRKPIMGLDGFVSLIGKGREYLTNHYNESFEPRAL